MENMFLKHTQCPRCKNNGKDNSGNNLAVYSDHSYCFSCGYYKKNEFVSYMRNERPFNYNTSKPLDKETDEKYKTSPKLPPDFVLSLPRSALNWINKYQITNKELVQNRIGWSENGFTTHGRGNQLIQYAPCMIFPIFDIYGTLLMYQARYFGTEKNYPKYITKGKPNEIIHILGKSTDSIVVVEDIISAIKVSRFFRAVPLFGSNARLDFWNRLASQTDTIILWLDPDKLKEAHRLQKRLSCIFNKVSVISSTCDPKECDDEYIRRQFWEHKDLLSKSR